MLKFLSFLNRNLTKIIWLLAILVWIGVGIYYLLSTYIPPSFLSLVFSDVSQKISEFRGISPTPSPTPKEFHLDDFLPPDVPSDAKMIVGTIAQLEPEKLVISTDGQEFDIAFGSDTYSHFADPDKGVIVGAKIRVYYQEENGKLKFISAMIL